MASITIAAAMALFFRLPIELEDVGIYAWVIAALLIVSRLWFARHGLTRIADCFGTVGFTWLAAIPCGFIALLGLRARMPTADALLMSLDQALAFDAIGAIEWELRMGGWLFAAMTFAYQHTVTAVFLSIAAASLLANRIEAWRAAYCFVGSLLTVCLVSIVMPAKGLGVWANDDLLARLGPGSMRYFWPSFDTFYSGKAPVLRLHAIDGVISFPSFHTAMGLITVAIWRGHPLTLAVSCVWFAFMLLGTMPFGGHYLVDLVGGAAVWAGWFAMSHRLEKPPTTTAAMATDPIYSGTAPGHADRRGKAS